MPQLNAYLSFDGTCAEAMRFDALSAGAPTVTMPMQESFWAEAFGMLVDRYGTPWIVNGALKEGYATRR